MHRPGTNKGASDGNDPGSSARELDKQPLRKRLRLERATVAKLCWFGCGYLVVVALTGWLVPSPSETTGSFHLFTWLFPTVIVFAFMFETIDSAVGMGFGTALAPLLLSMGYDALAVVPVLLIAQAITGLVTAAVHHEFHNVRFSVRNGMNGATKLMLLIALFGVIAVIASILLVYLALDLSDSIIKIYVAILVLLMGVIMLVQRFVFHGTTTFRPKRMIGFAALAGFNKGVGAGGYGPVITLGQLYAGVYEKSAAAITSLAEAWVSIAGAITFFTISAVGMKLNLVLLPSILAGSLLAAIVSPYLVRILPNRILGYLIPLYAIIIAVVLLARIFWA